MVSERADGGLLPLNQSRWSIVFESEAGAGRLQTPDVATEEPVSKTGSPSTLKDLVELSSDDRKCLERRRVRCLNLPHGLGCGARLESALVVLVVRLGWIEKKGRFGWFVNILV